MSNDNEVKNTALQFKQLCKLSTRRCAYALHISPTAFSDWTTGQVLAPRTEQGIAAYKHMQLVLEYDARTGGIHGARHEPPLRRLHLIQMVIAGAIE